jgi:hypothetical protein
MTKDAQAKPKLTLGAALTKIEKVLAQLSDEDRRKLTALLSAN